MSARTPKVPAAPRGRYANCFRIGHNAFEFLLDFGQIQLDGGEERFHTRIITGPFYMQELCNLLRESISQYEQSFGAIPTESE